MAYRRPTSPPTNSSTCRYLPRIVRVHKLYGMSPVEQIALTVNIALRRYACTLEYYRAGSVPDAFCTLNKEYPSDQIRQFQDYFDAQMAGNLRRGTCSNSCRPTSG